MHDPVFCIRYVIEHAADIVPTANEVINSLKKNAAALAQSPTFRHNRAREIVRGALSSCAE